MSANFKDPSRIDSVTGLLRNNLVGPQESCLTDEVLAGYRAINTQGHPVTPICDTPQEVLESLRGFTGYEIVPVRRCWITSGTGAKTFTFAIRETKAA